MGCTSLLHSKHPDSFLALSFIIFGFWLITDSVPVTGLYKRDLDWLFQKTFILSINSNPRKIDYFFQSVDNPSSIPTKRVRVELSDDGEYDSSQEEKQPIPTYSDTLFTIKNG